MQQTLSTLVGHAKNYRYDEVNTIIDSLLAGPAPLGENWFGVAKLASVVGSYERACQCLTLLPDSSTPMELKLKALSLQIECGQPGQALEKAEKLLVAFPHHPGIQHIRGVLHSQFGNNSQAQIALKEVVEAVPQAGETWLVLAYMGVIQNDVSLKTKFNDANQLILEQGSLPAKSSYLSAAGLIAWQEEDYEKAYQYFLECAELMKSISGFDLTAYHEQSTSLLTYAENLPNELISGDRQDCAITPIFILGMPRSGTTLLEQMLCADDDITAMGESGLFALACAKYIGASEITSPAQIDKLMQPELATQIASDYLNLLKERGVSTSRVADKSLDNIRYAPVIRQAFPDAPMIYLKRSEEDLAWSVFRHYFSSGLAWSWSVESIYHVIQGEKKLCQAWQKSDTMKIFSIQFEELLDEPEKVLNALFSDADIAPHSHWRAFHKNTSFIKTASVGQVREPLNKKGINASANVPEFKEKYAAVKGKLNGN